MRVQICVHKDSGEPYCRETVWDFFFVETPTGAGLSTVHQTATKGAGNKGAGTKGVGTKRLGT